MNQRIFDLMKQWTNVKATEGMNESILNEWTKDWMN